MSDHEAKQATPHATLLVELLDSRIPKSEREHAAAREIERLRQWELVGREWIDKTDWMQSRDAPVRWLGKHRADALREEIERLTANIKKANDQAEHFERDYVNLHPYCLHLWRPVGVTISLPGMALV